MSTEEEFDQHTNDILADLDSSIPPTDAAFSSHKTVWSKYSVEYLLHKPADDGQYQGGMIILTRCGMNWWRRPSQSELNEIYRNATSTDSNISHPYAKFAVVTSHLFLNNISVAGQERQGIGRALLYALAEWARTHGITYAEIEQANEKSAPFWNNYAQVIFGNGITCNHAEIRS